MDKVKRSVPALKRFVQKKTRRKLGRVKVVYRRHGRIGCYDSGRNTIYISRRLARQTPTLAKAVIVHELCHSLGLPERKAWQIEKAYLRSQSTSYRREALKYRHSL